ncbi:MAG: hypothetical protein AAGA68_07600 [Pseudomonadota bacterium]
MRFTCLPCPRALLGATALLSITPIAASAPPTLLLQATTSLQHRGLSRSAGHPAAAISIDQPLGDAAYLGVTFATIDLPGRPDEIRRTLVESYLGRSVSVGDNWRLRGDLVRYDFPNALEFSYTEIALGWSFRQAISGRLTYTRDALGENEPGGAVELSGHYPLADRWRLTATGGAQFFDRDTWNNHGFWRLGVQWLHQRVAVQLAGEGTLGDVNGIQGDRGDARLVLSISYAR